MQLTKWTPWGDVDQLFEEWSTSFPKFSWDMAVDVLEKDRHIFVRMNAPGIDLDKIDVTVVGNDVLRIVGTRDETREEKGTEFHRKEIRRGSFSRSISLPRWVEREKVEAEYKNGILEVRMPIAKGQRESSVKVRVQK